MSSKRPPSKSRPKISFAVDREEIGITSEWADTFIPSPASNRGKHAAASNNSPEEQNATVVAGAASSVKVDSRDDEAANEMQAIRTIANGPATVAVSATVVVSATAGPDSHGESAEGVVAEYIATVAGHAAEELEATAALNAPVVVNATAEECLGDADPHSESAEESVEYSATAVDRTPGTAAGLDATEELEATAAFNATVETHWVLPGTTEALNTSVVDNATGKQLPRRARAKPLRSVADGLTPGQLIVYTQMYAKGEGQETRFYRGGYHSLCALTGLSKRGLQNVIGELQAKNVVSLETPPGHNPSQVSVYRVRPEAEVLTAWYAAGLRFVMGKGKVLLAVS